VSTVLVVEDEPDLRLLAATLLQLDGHDVLEAGTGELALDLLRDNRIDVMLLDIKLPGISGWDVLSRIRAERLDGRPGVVVFSAHVGPVEARRAEELGAVAYLTKPYDDDALLRAVDVAAAAPD
jgi:CheY-like chemotaxis protein